MDAVSSQVLVKLAEDAIGGMIDPYAWDQLTLVEQEERALLEQTAKVWKGVRR